MHWALTNISFPSLAGYRLTTVYWVSEVSRLFSNIPLSSRSGAGRLVISAHAASHLRQPIHRVVSTRTPNNSSPTKSVPSARTTSGLISLLPEIPAIPAPISLKNFLLSIFDYLLTERCLSEPICFNEPPRSKRRGIPKIIQSTSGFPDLIGESRNKK